jgi:esterase
MWRNFALNDAISRQRDVFLVDLRNHGESDHHSSMTYEEMARDVGRFAESRGLNNYTLIGHNMGAKTAMMTATLFPKQVNGVICLDTAPTGTDPDKKAMTVASLESISKLEVRG